MRKNILFNLSLIVGLCCLFSLDVFAERAGQYLIMQIDNTKLVVNNITMEIDQQNTTPIVHNGSTMLPLRAVTDSITNLADWEVIVDWFPNENKAVVSVSRFDWNTFISSYEPVAEFRVGKTTAIINGEEKELPAAPVIINDRVLIPLRATAEALNLGVDWISEKNAALIYIHPPHGDILFPDGTIQTRIVEPVQRPPYVDDPANPNKKLLIGNWTGLYETAYGDILFEHYEFTEDIYVYGETPFDIERMANEMMVHYGTYKFTDHDRIYIDAEELSQGGHVSHNSFFTNEFYIKFSEDGNTLFIYYDEEDLYEGSPYVWEFERE